MVSDHNAKVAALHNYYQKLMGQQEACSIVDDLPSYFTTISLSSVQAASLVEPFTMDELAKIIASLRKAPY